MATEVPSCGIVEDDSVRVSVVQFIAQKSQTEELSYIQELYTEWQTILQDLSVNLTIRKTMDDWFMDVYKSRKDMRCMENNHMHNMFNETEERLYEDFMEKLTDRIRSPSESFHTKLELQAEQGKIDKDFASVEWIKTAIKCMEEECKLICKYTQGSSTQTREQDSRIEEELSASDAQNKTVESSLSVCTQELNAWDQLYADLEEKNKQLEDLILLLEYDQRQNGFNPSRKPLLEGQIEQAKKTIEAKAGQVVKNLEGLLAKLQQAVDRMRHLTTSVTAELLDWKRQFQFEYAQIYNTADLERIVPWCEKTGRLLDQLQRSFLLARSLFERAQSLFERAQAQTLWQAHGEFLEAQFLQMLLEFFQRSFVVVEQEDFVIKIEKKSFPKITVRFLAAEGLELGNVKVQAHFIHEDHIVQAEGGGIDKSRLRARQRAILCKEVPLKKGKEKGPKGASFSNMHFDGRTFTREESKDPNRMVHDEKYRLVFTISFQNHEFWTLSLPLVVTTGANQCCNALASVMWQCYSTDVYAVPIQSRAELPWCEVAKMVNQKFRRLCPDRQLTEENLNHLKLRLSGGHEIPDDEMISLKRFCFDKLFKDKSDTALSFSFWKWILANYNLLEKYLKDYWKNGLIQGFISKEGCRQKFKSCRSQRDGLFILRFSDNNITDSQGVKNVFGHLTSAVSNMVTKSGEKKRSVVDIDVAGHDVLKNKNLANKLKETLNNGQHVYQYLCPGIISREEAFDQYCKKDTIVDGYEGTRDAFIVDLEHALCRIELSTGKRTTSIDSGFEAASPAVEPACRGGKRQRSVQDQHPNISRMLSGRLADNPVSPCTDNMSYLSTPQQSPAFSVPSPATEARTNLMNDTPLLSCTPGSSPAYAVPSPGQLDAEYRMQQNNIPKVVEDFSPENPGTSRGAAQNRNIVPQTMAANQVSNHLDQWEHSSDFSGALMQQSMSPGPENYGAGEEVNEVVIIMPGNDAGAANSDNVMYPCVANLQGSLQNNSNTLTEEQVRQLVELLLHNTNTPADIRQALMPTLQARADMPSPGPPQVATDNTPEDIQTLNSSSGGSLSFPADMFEAAQGMDSGNIDTSVFDSQL